MGKFWDNATKEFGKKTGKAIGNKLYGKHADDYRKRVSFSGSSNVTVTQPSIDYDAIERAKQTTLECENNLKLLNTILNIEFKAKDVDGIIKNLTFLAASIDLWLKQSDKKRVFEQQNRSLRQVLQCLMLPMQNIQCYPIFQTKSRNGKHMQKSKESKT